MWVASDTSEFIGLQLSQIAHDTWNLLESTVSFAIAISKTASEGVL